MANEVRSGMAAALPGLRRTLLDAGTEVTARLRGLPQRGVVQSYEPEHSPDTFPVRFDDGQWRLLTANEVTVAAAPTPDARTAH